MSDISETNAVLCIKNWVKFRTSCYKPNTARKIWDDAIATCIKQVQGATLVSLDDKEEEDYVENIMMSKRSGIFHNITWPLGTWLEFEKLNFMCEYKLGKIYGLQMITVDSSGGRDG